MARILDPGGSRDGKLRPRERLFAAMPEAFQEGGLDTYIRMTMGIFPVARTSRTTTSVDPNSGRMFDEFICTLATIGFDEATQVLPSMDGDKIYGFDQLMPQLTLTGFVYDSNISIVDPTLNVRFDGNGYAEWSRFYEEARISQIARSNQIVRIRLHGMTLYGAFIGRNGSHDAQNPHKYDIVATFLISGIYNEATGSRALTDLLGSNAENRSGVAGFLTLEGAEQVGLIEGLLADPSPNQVFLSALPSADSVAGTLARNVEILPQQEPRRNPAIKQAGAFFRDI